MRLPHFIGYLLGIWLLCLPPVVVGLGIGVMPNRLELAVKPGTMQRKVINVANLDRAKPIRLTVGLADWRLNEVGGLMLEAPDSTTQSAAEWASFSPSELQLKPGEAKQVVVEIQIPATLEPPPNYRDYRLAIVFDTMLLPDEERKKIEEGKKGVWTKYQVTSLFYLTVMPAKAALTQESGKVVWKDGKPLLETALKNTGDTHARLKGELQLQDAAGSVAHKQAFENVVILEQQTQTAQLGLGELDKLPPGEYTIHLKAEKPALETAPEYQPPLLQWPPKPKK